MRDSLHQKFGKGIPLQQSGGGLRSWARPDSKHCQKKSQISIIRSLYFEDDKLVSPKLLDAECGRENGTNTEATATAMAIITPPRSPVFHTLSTEDIYLLSKCVVDSTKRPTKHTNSCILDTTS